jgi:hypothetical protein
MFYFEYKGGSLAQWIGRCKNSSFKKLNEYKVLKLDVTKTL